MNLTVSEMSVLRSFERFTAAANPGSEPALSMNCRYCSAAFCKVGTGLPRLARNRFVVIGLGAIGGDFLGFVQVRLRLGHVLVEVRVVDLAAQGQGQTELRLV